LKILVTGGAGFIGSAVVREAIRAGHDVLTIDKLTYAGRRESLAEVLGSPRHRFVRADIANRAAMTQAFAEFSPDAVLNLAAESHVDRSIDAPDAFVTSNVVGTFVLLEAALLHWSKLEGAPRDRFKFVQVSTDEVYGTLGDDGTFRPDSHYAPSSPYAASKAAGDHFARAWQRTYGLPVIITNCSNNYGPWQHGEKLVPTVIRSALAGEPIPIYGAGANGRDWLHVSDHAAGLFAALHRGRAGGSYLFGSGRSTRNLELATMICALLDARRRRPDGKPYAAQITFVADRPGHDFRYAVDPSHAEQELGWRSTEGLETGLAKTIEWYLDNPAWLAPQGLGRLGTLRARGPEQHGGKPQK
jgi:dTDP-glucose 4,6-dehydratase